MSYTHIKDISQYELCVEEVDVLYTYWRGTIFFLLNRNMSINSLTPILFLTLILIFLYVLLAWFNFLQ